MTLDLSKLSPAPWVNCGHELFFGRQRQGTRHQQILKEADAEFCALARNAFDIMMRRGWGCSHGPRGWWVNCPMEVCLKFGVNFKMEPFPDPFTALVEAEKWYVEHVENVEKQ